MTTRQGKNLWILSFLGLHGVALAGCGGGTAGYLAGAGSDAGAASSLSSASAVTISPRPHTTAKCPAASGGSGILPYGDFSKTAYPGSFETKAGGTIFAPDWDASGTSIDFAGSVFATPEGLCSVDLDGTPGPGGIRNRTLATVKGKKYAVTFLLSGNGACSPTVKTMTVTAAGESARFEWDISNGNDAQNGHFAERTWSFTADGATTTLEFTSDDPVGYCGAVVARISVT